MVQRIGLFLLALPLSVLCLMAQPPSWELSDSGMNASFRGISQADGTVWVSGTSGKVLRWTGSGPWQACSVPPGAEKLDFRGIWAFDGKRALVLSIGPGDKSRVYRTIDACATWQETLVNKDPKGFWDVICFSDERHGMILGDPVDGHFTILRTVDGGEHWTGDSAPPTARATEGAFAASNSSLIMSPSGVVYVGTSGPRVLILNSGAGSDWKSVDVPLNADGPASGVFSLSFRDATHGVAVGGNYENPSETKGTAAFTNDGGENWTAATIPPGGYRSAVGYDQSRKIWIAAGANGSDYSSDDGKTWTRIDDTTSWNALSLPWVVGPKGKIAKLVSGAANK